MKPFNKSAALIGEIVRRKNGDAAEFKRLLDAGADVNASDENGWTPLMLAAWYGDTAIVGMLIQAGADVNAKVKSGMTTALIAAGNNGPGMTRLLIEAGADVNPEEKDLMRAMRWWELMGHTDVVNILTEAATKKEHK